MEIVIPPRDHGGQTFKYNWDENGEVNTIQRIGQSRGRQTVHWPFQSVVTEDSIPVGVLEAAAAESAAMAAGRPSMHSSSSSSTKFLPKLRSTTARAARPIIEVPEESHRPYRPKTWQPRSKLFDASDDVRLDRSLIPDYVINYLRGETPETLAQRKAERQQQLKNEEERRNAEGENANQQDGRRSIGSTPSQDGSEDQILGGSDEKKRRRNRKARACFPTQGWRGGVAFNLLLALLILVAGLVCLVLAFTIAKKQSSSSSIAALVYGNGSCSTARTITWVLRALLAVVSFAIVAAAQYVFQIASSPTRANLDAAHSRRQWLDIGIPSMRNVVFVLFGRAETTTAMSKMRAIAGVAVVVVALAAAVLYSSLLVVVEASSTSCDVLLNTPILCALVGLNTVTVVCFLLVLVPGWRAKEASDQPLVTLGDSIASFLHEPDPTTQGACLLSKTDVWQGRWAAMAASVGAGKTANDDDDDDDNDSSRSNTPNTMMLRATALATFYRPEEYYWVRGPSLPRWFINALAWWVLAGLATAALVLAVMPDGNDASGTNTLGYFGRVVDSKKEAKTQYYYTTSLPEPASILASLPQLGLAILYLLADAHLSVYFLAHESAQYAAATCLTGSPHRPLRVSHHPRGHQTTSLYLTLPRVWSWLLLSLFAGLSFALGQGFVIAGEWSSPVSSSSSVVSEASSSSSSSSSSSPFFYIGFSGLGLLVFLVLLLVLAAIVLGLGCRRSEAAKHDLAFASHDSTRRASTATTPLAPPQGSPLYLPGGSCSAVISARCHAAPTEAAVFGHGEDNTKNLPLWQRPLAWGALPEYNHQQQQQQQHHHQDAANTDGANIAVGHCTFSSGPVLPLRLSQSYA